MSILKKGVYETEYGNAAAWDGKRAVDLDMMEEVPVDVLVPSKFLRRLEEEDLYLMGEATRFFGGQYRGY